MPTLKGNVFDKLYKIYGENPGKMLVHTGTLGWILSSLAQIGAIIFNDKITSEEKRFLVPQEMADAAVNILSFYFVSNTIKNIGVKLVSTGKISTPAIRDFLKKNGLTKRIVGSPKYENIGKMDFNIEGLSNFGEIEDVYRPFKNGVDTIFTTIGSILSCNLITPVLRNIYASKKQNEYLAKNQLVLPKNIKSPKGISIYDYQAMAASKFGKGSMRI